MTEQEEEDEERSDHFPWPVLKSLAQFLHSLKISSLFLSSFRLYVQRILLICQLFQRTKHCSSLCTIYQRVESSMEPRFGLEPGRAASPSQIHLYMSHCRGVFFPSCLFLCLVFVSVVLYHFHPMGFLDRTIASMSPGSENIIRYPQPLGGQCLSGFTRKL